MGVFSRALVFPSLLSTADQLGTAGVNAGLVFYGIAASVFAQCLHAYLSLLQLFPAPSLNIDSDEPENIPFQYENTRPKRLQLLTVCAIFVCGSMFLFTTSWLHNIGMIENALFSVGREELFDGRSPQPVVALGNVSFLLTGWLTGGFMVYRCYVVYSSVRWRWLIMLGPGIMYLGSCVSGAWLLSTVLPAAVEPLSTSKTPRVHKLTLTTLYLTTFLNLTTASLISARIVMFRRTRPHRNLNRPTSPKMLWVSKRRREQAYAPFISVTSILVESSVLNAVFGLAFLIEYARGSDSAKLLFPILGQMQVIAPLFIGHRLSKDKAWTAETGADGPGIELVARHPGSNPPIGGSRNIETYQTGPVSLRTFDEVDTRPNVSGVYSFSASMN